MHINRHSTKCNRNGSWHSSSFARPAHNAEAPDDQDSLSGPFGTQPPQPDPRSRAAGRIFSPHLRPVQNTDRGHYGDGGMLIKLSAPLVIRTGKPELNMKSEEHIPSRPRIEGAFGRQRILQDILMGSCICALILGGHEVPSTAVNCTDLLLGELLRAR